MTEAEARRVASCAVGIMDHSEARDVIYNLIEEFPEFPWMQLANEENAANGGSCPIFTLKERQQTGEETEA